MSCLTKFYTFEIMDNAVVYSASSQATGHPPEHAIAPLEPYFAWQADEASAANGHQLIIDLGDFKQANSVCFFHHESEEDETGLDVSFAGSPDGSLWYDLDIVNHDGSVVSDVEPENLIKVHHFTDDIVVYRYWRITLGKIPPSPGASPPPSPYYPPSDTRLSMFWLANRLELDIGPAIPLEETIIYPQNTFDLSYQRTQSIGYNLHKSISFTRTWQLTAAQYATINALLLRCNGTQRPFLFFDVDGSRRLCYFEQPTIEETILIPDELYRVTLHMKEIPLLGKDVYY